MAIIKWTTSMDINISDIDIQHRKLGDIINKLHDAMKERKTDQVMGGIIRELVTYTDTHFKYEEKNYLEKFDYPDIDEHKKKHRAFVQKISDFETSFKNGKLMLSMEIITFLKDWLIKHIQGTDQEYSNYFKSKGLI